MSEKGQLRSRARVIRIISTVGGPDDSSSHLDIRPSVTRVLFLVLPQPVAFRLVFVSSER